MGSVHHAKKRICQAAAELSATEATSDEQLAFKQKERELASYTRKVRPRSVEFLHIFFDGNVLYKKKCSR